VGLSSGLGPKESKMRSNLLGMCSAVASVAVAGSAMASVQSYSTDFSNFNTG